MPDDHPYYRDCDDDTCPRFPCRLYREGCVDTYPRAWDDGYIAGSAAGFGAGFEAGVASVPSCSCK